MDKRDFLKLALLAPLLLKYSCKKDSEILKGDEKSFEFLEVSGSYFEIGVQIGKKISATLKQILEERHTWFNNLNDIAKSSAGQSYSDKLYKTANNLFPQYISELNGIANGSGFDFDTLWTLNIKNELSGYINNDVSSSVLYYKDKDNSWLFHNFNADKSSLDRLLLIKVLPETGVNFFSLIQPGNLAGSITGMNNYGICNAVNHISSSNNEIGVPASFINRSVLESKNIFEAVENATVSPRTIPANHNILSLNKKMFASVETLPTGKVQINYPEDGIHIHTNHLLGDETAKFENQNQEYIENISKPRLSAMQTLISSAGLPLKSIEQVMRIMGSHYSKQNSPCVHFDEKNNGNTLATTFFDLNTKKMRIYKGNPCKSSPDENYWEYSF